MSIMFNYIYIYILADHIRRWPKALFSIATTLRCRGGRYSFCWIAPLTLDPYLIMLSVNHQVPFFEFFTAWHGIERRYYGLFTNSLTIMQIYINTHLLNHYFLSLPKLANFQILIRFSVFKAIKDYFFL